MSLPLMSLHGGILISVILLLRAICKNRLPRVTFLILWGMALLRLLVPFSIPARFSIYSLISQQEIWQDNCTDVDNGILGNSIDAGLGWLETAENWHSLCNDIDFGIIITIIRWTGTLLCALLFFAIYYICMRRFCSSLPVKNEYVRRWVSGHPLRRPMVARQSDRVSTPLTYGILKPVILLPGELEQLEEEKMEYILQHEYRHICRFDGIWKFLMVPTACLHWFNPMVWIMYFILSRDIEMACDESVLKHFGAAAKKTYARILLEMSEENRIFKTLYNAFGGNATEERIRAIMKYKKKTFAAVITAIVLVTMVACGFATSEQPNNMDTAGQTTETLSGDNGSGTENPDEAMNTLESRETSDNDATGSSAKTEASETNAEMEYENINQPTYIKIECTGESIYILSVLDPPAQETETPAPVE